jgi:nitrate/TMAO reductase-like tetraheme cytochrome c subunit
LRIGKYTFAGYIVALVIGIGLILSYGAMEASSTPAFCGTCHVMKPYFESWEVSDHSEIACVDCHIPPGITAELRKKYEAAAMVARYFTGTYGMNPWTEVEDAACLECHERRLLKGKVLFGSVLFDHGPHLTELRRGKRLRCTSCHSQIVQGSHITVTQTTCTLCHFKGQPAGEGTAECILCHEAPKTVVAGEDLKFNHGDVERFGMECTACHTPPSPESGSVPKERCLSCHNQQSRLERYEDGDELHLIHVTEHKVECTHCHLEIEHVTPQHLDSARTDCETCHGSGHSPQRDLYAGIGGKGVEPMPDVMYQAGIRCEGCHLDDGEGETRTAGEVSCMSCHGPGYRGLFTAWGRALDQRTKGLRRQLDQTVRRVGLSAGEVFDNARFNLELVERGHGIHNYRYSLAVLDTAHEQMNEARRNAGLEPLGTPWPSAAYSSDCLSCHSGIEIQQGVSLGRRFSHGPHVVRAGLDCLSCHTSHQDREVEGVAALTIGSTDCSSCHHGRKRECTSCHSQVLGTVFETDLGSFSHEIHVDDMELSCALCHGEGRGVSAPDLEV